MANPSGPPPSPVNIAISNLGTSSIQVLAGNPTFRKLIFHNPNITSGGGVSIGLAAGFDPNGNPVTASYSASGAGAGSIALLPGATFEVEAGDDRVTTSWQAIAQSGSNNALTIFAFLSQPKP